MSEGRPRLYVLPASHPCAAVEAALKIKGIAFDRTVLLPLTPAVIGPLRWHGTTVPGMRLGAERLVGSRPIMRRLDELAPEPPLLPAPGDPAQARVLEAERWGDEVLQSASRRIIYAAFVRGPEAMEGYAAGQKLPLPIPLLRPALPLTARLGALKNRGSEERARADAAALPRMLDSIDGWIAEGLLGGELANAADLQIGSSIRLLMSIADVRPLIEDRPATKLTRYFPPLVGEVPPGTLPAQWLPLPETALQG